MCTTQLVKLQQRLPELAAAGAAVFAVSIDPPEQARQVAEQYRLSFPILSDPRMEIIRPYGMKGDGMEMADLGYVVIDRVGRIQVRRIDREFGDHVERLLHGVDGRITVDTQTRLWWVSRWGLVTLVLLVVAKTAIDTIRGRPGFHNVPFQAWYGDWREVLVVTAIFLAFLLGFARPRRVTEWRSAGVYAAFLISLFTEMFGVPLTIYLLAPALGLPATAFGMNESHLWAFALDRLGLLPLRWGVFAVMAISTVLIGAGLGLLAVGWAAVYRGRDGLVTGGVYRRLRHPQYLGLILIVIAFNLMWPTLPTLLMAPVLIVMYVRLARREDRELTQRFGWAFAAYAAHTPAFVPGARGRVSRDVWPLGGEDAGRDADGHSSRDVPDSVTADAARSSEPDAHDAPKPEGTPR